jgi:NADH:ubiquinone oxidoreductase subunit 6 (subunit J)
VEARPLIQSIFLLFSAIGLMAALGTVLSRNLVRAALWLVAFFFIIAVQFVLLEAEFLAAIQVLVYIGAVAILLLFGIMLTRNIQGDETTSASLNTKLIFGALGLALFAVLATAIVSHKGTPERPAWSKIQGRPDDEAGRDGVLTRKDTINNMAKTVGDEMMTRFVIPFEIAGLLLTVALVGAVALARQVGADEPIDRVRKAGFTRDDAPANGSPEGVAETPGAVASPSH